MIATRLTERLGLELPLMLAPMALAGGGELMSSRGATARIKARMGF